MHKLVDEIFPGDKILCAGFVKNPPQSQKNQMWHIDYGMNVKYFSYFF